MNKLQDKWLKKFIRLFDLEKYKKTLYIDGISVLRILHSTGKFKLNKKLLIFMENGWFNQFILTQDKIVYLSRFNKLYKKHNVLDPKRARRDLKPNTKYKLRRNSSQPLLIPLKLLD